MTIQNNNITECLVTINNCLVQLESGYTLRKPLLETASEKVNALIKEKSPLIGEHETKTLQALSAQLEKLNKDISQLNNPEQSALATKVDHLKSLIIGKMIANSDSKSADDEIEKLITSFKDDDPKKDSFYFELLVADVKNQKYDKALKILSLLQNSNLKNDAAHIVFSALKNEYKNDHGMLNHLWDLAKMITLDKLKNEIFIYFIDAICHREDLIFFDRIEKADKYLTEVNYENETQEFRKRIFEKLVKQNLDTPILVYFLEKANFNNLSFMIESRHLSKKITQSTQIDKNRKPIEEYMGKEFVKALKEDNFERAAHMRADFYHHEDAKEKTKKDAQFFNAYESFLRTALETNKYDLAKDKMTTAYVYKSILDIKIIEVFRNQDFDRAKEIIDSSKILKHFPNVLTNWYELIDRKRKEAEDELKAKSSNDKK